MILNIHKQAMSQVVRDVLRKIVAQDLRLGVWIDPYGDVTVKQNRPDKRQTPPDEWLVGEYNWRLSADLLQADMEARAAELRPIYRRLSGSGHGLRASRK